MYCIEHLPHVVYVPHESLMSALQRYSTNMNSKERAVTRRGEKATRVHRLQLALSQDSSDEQNKQIKTTIAMTIASATCTNGANKPP